MRRRPTLVAQQGFTLVELMVAAFVLVVGMLATVGVLGTGLRKTTLNAQRVAASNLARELTEAARIARYTQLTPTTVVTAIRGSGTNLGSGTPWTVIRRGTTYTVEATACTYDDPADKLEATPPANRCTLPTGTDTTSGDNNGDDFRRVTFNVRWRQDAKDFTYTQTALVVNPSGGLGPRIVTMPSQLPTVTESTPGSTVHFDLTTTDAEAVRWNADDGLSSGDATGGRTAWGVDWDIKSANSSGAVLDGTYSISAQPFDDRGVAGETKVTTVFINRSAPFAVKGLRGGASKRGWVDLEWSLNAERDIVGYRVYDAGANKSVGGGDDRLVCPAPSASPDYLANTATSCQDVTPPAAAAKYFVVALDRDNAATPKLREGAASSLLDVAPAGTAPTAPVNLTISAFAPPTLNWTPQGSATIAFYRVYRDGTAPANRISKVINATSYVDDGGEDGNPHDYWVSAVDSSFNESALLGPVHFNG